MANISHTKVADDFEKVLAVYRKKHGDKPDVLAIINALTEFSFGRFLLQHRGINGFWTQYMCTYPDRRPTLANEMEEWILNTAPVFLATQQRFKIFRQQLQTHVRDGVHMASIPCGLMDDLLGLDWTGVKDFSLTGIDIDQESLDLAARNSAAYQLEKHCHFVSADAWNLPFESTFDVITSNGLNIYEPDDEKVVALYGQFHKALKPGGVLVTSFLTAPPVLDPSSPWKLDRINPADLARQRTIFADILEVKWQTFRSHTKTELQLKEAGFKTCRFIDDPNCLFPTVVATR